MRSTGGCAEAGEFLLDEWSGKRNDLNRQRKPAQRGHDLALADDNDELPGSGGYNFLVQKGAAAAFDE